MDTALNSWTEDDRSIGFSDADEPNAYIPIIAWNFDIIKWVKDKNKCILFLHALYTIRYVSHPTDHFCAFLVNIRPLGTDSIFQVIWKPDWVGNFRKVMQANRKYSHGVVLRNKPFEEKLWSEMIDRCLNIFHYVSY